VRSWTLGIAVAMQLAAASAWAEKTVTIWLPSEIEIDPASTRIATVSQGAGTTKLGDKCTKKAGKYDTFGVIILDLGSGATYTVEIATEKLPGKGVGVDLTSLRADGECTEGGRKWRKYNAVVGEAPAPTAKPSPRAHRRTRRKRKTERRMKSDEKLSVASR
jgi:hypothetical protein